MSDLLKYKKLTDIEHVLLRPGMYVGSIKHRTDDISVYDGDKFKTESVTYNPAFLKIFDEIVSNSVDEHRRNPKAYGRNRIHKGFAGACTGNKRTIMKLIFFTYILTTFFFAFWYHHRIS